MLTILTARAWRLMLPIIAIGIVLGAGQDAQARTVEEAIKRLAIGVDRYLKTRNEDSIVIGEFKGPAGSPIEGKIKKELKAELETRNVTIKTTNAMEVSGRFSVKPSPDGSTVTIQTKMFDKFGNQVFAFQDNIQQSLREQTVDDQEDVVVATGASVDTVTPDAPAGNDPAAGNNPPAGNNPNGGVTPASTPEPSTPAQQNQAIAESIQNPSVSVQEGLIAAKPNSPFRIQILVENQGTGAHDPCPTVVQDGFAFAQLKENDIYAIRVINENDFDVAAKISIDGINIFEFANNAGFKDLGCYVIPRNSEGIIRGWYINDGQDGLAELNKFLVVPDEQSELAKLGLDRGKLGTISVSFFPCWGENEEPPAVETSGTRSGTGRGPAFNVQVKTVKRFFGKTLLATVSCRYFNPEPVDIP